MKKQTVRLIQKILITAFTTLFAFMLTATGILKQNESTITTALGQRDFYIEYGEGDDGPKELFKTDYKSVREVVYAGYETQLEEQKEGTVLLKNDNDALPLKKGSKISVFGAASVYPFYGASGSGGISTTYALDWYDSFAGTHYEKADPKAKVTGEPYFSVNEKLKTEYEKWVEVKQTPWSTVNVGEYAPSSSVSKVSISDVPWNVLSAGEGYADIANYGDAALMIIKRTGGEGYDLPATTGKNKQYGNTSYATSVNCDGVNGDYLALNENEKSILGGLKQLKKEGKVKKIVLILNMASTIELSFLKNNDYDIDACLWTGSVGTYGTVAVTKLLCGEWNFSGGLSATLWYDNLANPVNSNFTDQNYFFTYSNYKEFGFTNPAEAGQYQSSMSSYMVYQEGMYLGYKYTETRYEDYVTGVKNVGEYKYDEVVAYPFGYGKSYSEFEFTDMTVKEAGKTYEVSVKVTNTGSKPGKTPVQVYVAKPYGEYERKNQIQVPSVQLIDFGKTRELAAGDSETVTISVDQKYMATYDTFGAGTYVMTPGEYRLIVAKNAHEAVNSLLADKGYTPETTNNRMDKEGNTDLVYKFSLSLDKQTYSLSSATNNPIANSFEFGDINTYSGKGGNSVKYYSRDDWNGTVALSYRKADGTLVKPHATLTMTKQMADELRDQMDAKKVIEKGGEYPTYGKNLKGVDAEGYGIPNDDALKLIDLLGEDYDSPMWEDLLDQLTWMDTVYLLSNGRHKTVAIASVAKPSTWDENGPNGLSGYFATYAKASGGSAYSGPSLPYADRIDDPDLESNYKGTGFSSNGILAATFNKDLAKKVGKQIGEESFWIGVAGLLGVGLNIQRSPYSGRTAEYYSEDAMLSGLIAAPEVKAIESMGVHCFIKHCAINESETARHGVQCWMTEQAMRENYFRAFEIAIEEGESFNVMTSFSRIGTQAVANCVPFAQSFLRNECGLPGIIETDCAGDMTDGKHGEPYASRIVNVYLGATDLNEYNYGNDVEDYTGSGITYADFAPDANGKGEYGTLGQAMRKAAKRILYATLTSNSMSTMSSASKIVKVTPPWKVAVNAANISLGILLGLSVLWLVADIVWRYIKANKAN
ncbi:MAG TPA: hypothetical protein DDY77_03510 [Clostridiales bacterium]|nr:hypothetical protein [Clostridiales bacterium]